MSFYSAIVNAVINSVILDEDEGKKARILKELNEIQLPTTTDLQEKDNIELITISNILKTRLNPILDQNIPVMPRKYDGVYPHVDRVSGVNPLTELQESRVASEYDPTAGPSPFVVPGPGTNIQQAHPLAEISMEDSQRQARKGKEKEEKQKEQRAKDSALQSRMQQSNKAIEALRTQQKKVSPIKTGSRLLEPTENQKAAAANKKRQDELARKQKEAAEKENRIRPEFKTGGKGGSKKLKFKNFRRTKRKNLRK